MLLYSGRPGQLLNPSDRKKVRGNHLTSTAKDVIRTRSGQQNQVQAASLHSSHFKRSLGGDDSMLHQGLPLC